MNNKVASSILLSMSGLIIALGVASSQIAKAIVKAGFYAGHNTGAIPAGPESASVHWLVILPTVVLAALGLYFLFAPDKAG